MSKAVVALSFVLGILGIAIALSPLDVPGGLSVALGMIAFHLLPLLAERRLAPVVPDVDRFLTGATTAERRERFGRIFGTLSYALFGVISIGSGHALGGTMAFILGGAWIPVVLWGVAEQWRRGTSGTWVIFERTMMTVTDEDGALVFAYRDITKVEAGALGVWLDTRFGRTFIRTSDDAVRAKALAQRIEEKLTEARARAEAADALPDMLRRPKGVPLREWLGRLDGIAKMAGDAAYRATELDDDALVAVLADRGAEPDARVAAARLLAGRRELARKVRVAVETIEDPEVRLRVEAASKEQLDEAAAELEAIETREILRAATE